MTDPACSPLRMTSQRIRELFAELDAAVEPGQGSEPARQLAKAERPAVFRELIWRMHNHPSPEVRYWCCYELCWEQPASGEFVEVLERLDEHPRIRAQACEGLAYVLEFAKPTLAWYRRAEAVLLCVRNGEIQTRHPQAAGADRQRPGNVARLVAGIRRGGGCATEHRPQADSGPCSEWQKRLDLVLTMLWPCQD